MASGLTEVSDLAARNPIHPMVDINIAQDRVPVMKLVCHGERMMRSGHTGHSEMKPNSSHTGQPKMNMGMRNQFL
jgi:hypothetical protein